MNNKLIIMLLVLFVTGTSNLFSQNMNKRTEETPQTVIANVHKAAELLKEGKSVTDVAAETGFVNTKYFSSLFKKQFGMQPSKYSGK